ncbi:hypothetical protein GQ473_07190 [archaeon]|nr:hypothetical protein [archaeon]
MTNTIIYAVAILFFAFMALYNLKIAIKEKKDYVPAIVGFLFTLMVVLFFFEQMFYGLMLLTLVGIISTIWLLKLLWKYLKDRNK